MSNKSISVVTPTLNSAKTLRQTLESLRPIVEMGGEHIVVDSGSTDGSVEIAKQFGSVVIHHPPGNMYSAINAGVAISTKDWITYINSDDILFSDYILKVFQELTSDVDFFYGDIDFIDDCGRFLFGRRAPTVIQLRLLSIYYSCVPQQGTVFRRNLFERLNGFDDSLRFVADRDFFMRCLFSGAVFKKVCGLSAAAFRLSADQLSQKNSRDMFREGTRSRDQFLKDHDLKRTLFGYSFSHLYRWSTNIDNLVLRELRGRGQDSGMRVK